MGSVARLQASRRPAEAARSPWRRRRRGPSVVGAAYGPKEWADRPLVKGACAAPRDLRNPTSSRWPGAQGCDSLGVAMNPQFHTQLSSLALSLVFMTCGPLAAQLAPGHTAPDFELRDLEGSPW